MKHVHTFESYLNEAQERFHITDGKGNYLTRKSMGSDYSFTDNWNFAYTYDSEKEAEKVISGIKNYPAFKGLDIQVISQKDIKK